jgi:putative DNA primase/helicase
MNLSDLLGRLDAVERTADGFLARCPAHDDTDPSLRVAVGKTGKVLLKCRAGCETEAVLDALDLTMHDLTTMTVDDVAVPVAASTDEPATDADVATLTRRLARYVAAAKHDSAQAAQDYARRRFGVDRVDFERLGLGLADDLMGGPRLVVPFRDRDGVARGFQARSLDDGDPDHRWVGPRSPRGRAWTKVGYFPSRTDWPQVFITEGPGDALTAAVAGYDAIAVRGASLTSPTVAAEVADLVGDRLVILAGDGDGAGRKFSTSLSKALADSGLRVKVLPLPNGVDLTSWRENDSAHFADALRDLVTNTPEIESRAAALLAWDEDRYALSDLGAARYLRDYIESLGSGVRYVEEMGFYLLDRGVWRPDERQSVRTYAQEVADLVKSLADAAFDVYRESNRDADKARAGRFWRYAEHAQTSRGIDAMVRELQAVRGVPASPDEFDRHADLLATRNGVVDLRTGTLRPHDASLMLTRRVDLDFDPTAEAPRWLRFLDEVFPGEPDLPAYMRRLVGYGITGHTSEQCFVVLWGTGANGKSVFTDTLTQVFRELTVTTPFQTFEERPTGGIPNDLAALKGARLVMAAEGERGKPMAESVLKRVTGHDLISARFMRREFFEFRPTFLLLLATNHRPQFRGQDEGLWRRVKLVPWVRYFAPDERDPYLSDALVAEAPGILAWAVRGAGEWYRDGLRDPDVIRAAVRGYREQSDVLGDFIGEGGRYLPDPAGRVPATTLFHDFQAWADEENFGDLRKWSSRAFYAAVEERGFERVKSHGERMFVGLRRARPSDHADATVTATTPVTGAATPTSPSPYAGADLTEV